MKLASCVCTTFVLMALSMRIMQIAANPYKMGPYGSAPFSKFGPSSIGTTGIGSAIGSGFSGHPQGSSLLWGTSGGTRGLGATHASYERNIRSDSSKKVQTSGAFGHPGYPKPPYFVRNSPLGSSSLNSGSSTGTMGHVAAIGSGPAATINICEKKGALSSSSEAGTSSSTSGYGAASGFGYINYGNGHSGLGSLSGHSKYFSGVATEGTGNAAQFAGSDLAHIYVDGYASEDGQRKTPGAYTGSYGYDGKGGYAGTFGYGGGNAFEGYTGGVGYDRGSKREQHLSNYILADETGNYVGVNAIGSHGSHVHDAAAKYIDSGYYGVSGLDGAGYAAVGHHSNNEGHFGHKHISYDQGINKASGGANYGKLGYTGTVNYFGGGLEDNQRANAGLHNMHGSNSYDDLGAYSGANMFSKDHIIHSGKDAETFGAVEGYDHLLHGSASSSGFGGSSSSTSGHGAALGATTAGRAQSSSLHDGVSEATSGPAAAMGTYGKNQALGSSGQRGTSTGTSGLAAANALGHLKTRSGTFGSSSSSGFGGSSSGTSGFAAAAGANEFGRAHSSSLHDGTSGASSGPAATQSLYGVNRAIGSSNVGGTSSSTGGYGAANALGYGHRPGGSEVYRRKHNLPYGMVNYVVPGNSLEIARPNRGYKGSTGHYPGRDYVVLYKAYNHPGFYNDNPYYQGKAELRGYSEYINPGDYERKTLRTGFQGNGIIDENYMHLGSIVLDNSLANVDYTPVYSREDSKGSGTVLVASSSNLEGLGGTATSTSGKATGRAASGGEEDDMGVSTIWAPAKDGNSLASSIAQETCKLKNVAASSAAMGGAFSFAAATRQILLRTKLCETSQHSTKEDFKD